MLRNVFTEHLATLYKDVETVSGLSHVDCIAGLNSVQSLTFLDEALLEQEKFGTEMSRPLILHLVKKFLQKMKFVIQDHCKLFNDPVLGSINVHPIAMLMIDTPQFQRLRYIGQLATLSYVYPSGSYHRFEHSLGVYHLAGKLVNLLKEKQPELTITSIDAMCVQLAGLAHDLGHGPFSHLFDRRVIPHLIPNTTWSHEQASLDMIDHLCSQPVVRQGFQLWGFRDRDLEFVKALIMGEPNEELTGRGKSKQFLYEIVANDRNGMDVDKWDFFARDCYHLGIKNSFEHERFMHHLRVIDVDGTPEICVRDKEVDTIYNMFYTRYDLHRKAYQHPVGRSIEMMVSEAIVRAAKHLKFNGKTIEECIYDMNAYTKLNDGIFFKIMDSDDEELRESRELLERIHRRVIWKCVGQARVDSAKQLDVKELQDELIKVTGVDNIRVEWCQKHFGKKEANPLDYTRFYAKNSPTVACNLTEEQKSMILPKRFQHQAVSVYCTSVPVTPDVYTAVEEAFKRRNLIRSLSHD